MQENKAPVPIQLDTSYAIKMNMGVWIPGRAMMKRSDVWHKIKIVRGAQYDKETVLKIILNAIDPAHMLPVKYQVSGEDSFFLTRDCEAALDILCKCNLIIKNPKGDPLILVATLGYAACQYLKMNIQDLFLTALTRRYNLNKKLLNLEEFHKNPDISETIYAPLSQQRTFKRVLRLASQSITAFETLNLQRNELVSLALMKSCNLAALKYLDLRHNNLYNMDCLAPLKDLSIIKLWLDGNPLCENYSNPIQYVESARKYCPSLKQLDGVSLGTSGTPPTYKSYFKNESRRELSNQFISHFFNLYDQGDRTLLRGLYHKDAFYSMSCGIAPALCHKRSLGQFTACRNILRSTELSKKSQHIYCGQDNILLGLKKLPRCYHDKDSFICDLMFDDDSCFVISVGGLFKTLTSSPQVLTFMRTFVLIAGEDNEYNILNDQYHVELAPEDITADKVETKISFEEFIPMCFNATERRELKAKFETATSLNDEWCDSYLDEAKWDIRKAINSFIKDYKSSIVPAHAFEK